MRLSIDNAVRATAFAGLGSIYREQRKYPQAKQNYDFALQVNPDLPVVLVGSGPQKGWDFENAASQYEHAMFIEPTSVGYLLLAKALEQSGRAAEAKDAYAAAQRALLEYRADQKAADGPVELNPQSRQARAFCVVNLQLAKECGLGFGLFAVTDNHNLHVGRIEISARRIKHIAGR